MLENFAPGKTVKVRATKADGTVTEFDATVRIDTPQEVQYYQHGGILQYVLRQLLQDKAGVGQSVRAVIRSSCSNNRTRGCPILPLQLGKGGNRGYSLPSDSRKRPSAPYPFFQDHEKGRPALYSQFNL